MRPVGFGEQLVAVHALRLSSVILGRVLINGISRTVGGISTLPTMTDMLSVGTQFLLANAGCCRSCRLMQFRCPPWLREPPWQYQDRKARGC